MPIQAISATCDICKKQLFNFKDMHVAFNGDVLCLICYDIKIKEATKVDVEKLSVKVNI